MSQTTLLMVESRGCIALTDGWQDMLNQPYSVRLVYPTVLDAKEYAALLGQTVDYEFPTWKSEAEGLSVRFDFDILDLAKYAEHRRIEAPGSARPIGTVWNAYKYHAYRWQYRPLTPKSNPHVLTAAWPRQESTLMSWLREGFPWAACQPKMTDLGERGRLWLVEVGGPGWQMTARYKGGRLQAVGWFEDCQQTLDYLADPEALDWLNGGYYTERRKWLSVLRQD